MTKGNRGGLRSPAGGRPTKTDKKIKTSISISQAAIDKARQAFPDEPLSQVIERLLHSLP